MRDDLKYKICRILKAVQLFFVSLVVILEIVQVATFPQFFGKFVAYLRGDNYDSRDYGGYSNYSDNSNYSNNSNYSSSESGPFYFNSPTILGLLDPSLKLNPAELYFTNAVAGKGPTVIWVFIVMITSFMGLIGYTLIFRKIWNLRKHILFIGFDAAFVLLWVSEVFTNLIWIYNGISSPCYLISITEQISILISVSFPELKTVCGAYTASNVFGWFVLVSFVIGFGFSFKVYKDAKSEDNIDKINNMSILQQIHTPLQAGSLQEQAESLQELPPQIREPSSAAQ